MSEPTHPSGKDPKVDYRLALGYGSAWHLLRYLGWHREKFSRIIAQAVGASRIDWLDFPPYSGSQGYPTGAAIRDGEWTGIDFCEDADLKHAYATFWPTKGNRPNWDAIGKAEINGREEWILVEAKAHLAEVSGKGTGAKEEGGRPKIRQAFRETLEAMGHSPEEAERKAEDWLSGYYQNANRLATLHFFGKHRVPARLVFLYFCGDRKPGNKPCPAGEAEWRPLLTEVDQSLGLTGNSDLEKRVHKVFLFVDSVAPSNGVSGPAVNLLQSPELK